MRPGASLDPLRQTLEGQVLAIKAGKDLFVTRHRSFGAGGILLEKRIDHVLRCAAVGGNRVDGSRNCLFFSGLFVSFALAGLGGGSFATHHGHALAMRLRDLDRSFFTGRELGFLSVEGFHDLAVLAHTGFQCRLWHVQAQQVV